MSTLTVAGFMNSNRQFNVALDGTFLSHTTNLNSSSYLRCANLLSQSTERQIFEALDVVVLVP